MEIEDTIGALWVGLHTALSTLRGQSSRQPNSKGAKQSHTKVQRPTGEKSGAWGNAYADAMQPRPQSSGLSYFDFDVDLIGKESTSEICFRRASGRVRERAMVVTLS